MFILHRSCAIVRSISNLHIKVWCISTGINYDVNLSLRSCMNEVHQLSLQLICYYKSICKHIFFAFFWIGINCVRTPSFCTFPQHLTKRWRVSTSALKHSPSSQLLFHMISQHIFLIHVNFTSHWIAHLDIFFCIHQRCFVLYEGLYISIPMTWYTCTCGHRRTTFIWICDEIRNLL